MTSKKKYRKILKYLKFMNIAKQIATLSYDPKHQVSAILVKKDFSNIHSMGYNGNYEGGPNERDSMEHGQSGFIHAEENALLKKNTTKEDLQENYIMFVTMTPCSMCAKKMVNAGIKEVCILNVYNNVGNTEEVFKKSNVNFYYLEDKIKELLVQNSVDMEFSEKKNELFITPGFDQSEIEQESMKYIVSDFFDNSHVVKSYFGSIYETMLHTSEMKIGHDFYKDFYNIVSNLISKEM